MQGSGRTRISGGAADGEEAAQRGRSAGASPRPEARHLRRSFSFLSVPDHREAAQGSDQRQPVGVTATRPDGLGETGQPDL